MLRPGLPRGGVALAKKDARRVAQRLGLPRLRAHVLVCTAGSCAPKARQKRALKEARRAVRAQGLHRAPGRVVCSRVGCLGVCRDGPIAVVWPDGVFYRDATPENLRRIVREHLGEGRPVEELCIARPDDERDAAR